MPLPSPPFRYQELADIGIFARCTDHPPSLSRVSSFKFRVFLSAARAFADFEAIVDYGRQHLQP